MSIDTTAVIDTTPADTAAAIPSSVVYVTADPDRPPYDYIGRHRCGDEDQAAPTPRRRGRKLLAGALALVGITLTIACGVGVDSSDAPPLSDSPPAAKANVVTDGQYRVGSEIKPGTYTTTVRGKASDVLASCYWARLKAFDGDDSSIIDNKMLGGGAHGRMTVKASDVGVEFSGGCVWTKAAK